MPVNVACAVAGALAEAEQRLLRIEQVSEVEAGVEEVAEEAHPADAPRCCAPRRESFRANRFSIRTVLAKQ